MRKLPKLEKEFANKVSTDQQDVKSSCLPSRKMKKFIYLPYPTQSVPADTVLSILLIQELPPLPTTGLSAPHPCGQFMSQEIWS